MAPLPDVWDEVAPNGCFDLSATPGSDPEPPQDVCKLYVSLLILKLPLGED
jgi:hypothetical protein